MGGPFADPPVPTSLKIGQAWWELRERTKLPSDVGLILCFQLFSFTEIEYFKFPKQAIKKIVDTTPIASAIQSAKLAVRLHKG